MFTYRRKNGKLNAALSGLERGIQTGLGIGMRARAMDEDAAQAQFERDQALRKAQIVDAELQREEQGRQAAGEAMQSLAAPEETVQFDMNPMTGPAVTAARATVQQDQAMARVGAIARRLAESGDLKSAAAFLEESKAKHKKLVDDGERKSLVDAIHRDVQSDTLFATQPDGTRMSNPETEKAMQALIEMSGNPNVPVDALKAQRVALKRAVSDDRARLAHRKSMTMRLDQDISTLAQAQQTQPGPITPQQFEAQSRQMQRLQGLRDQFDVFYDEIHGVKGGALSFAQQWDNAKNGIAFVNPRTGRPVTFAEEDSVREAEAMIQQQDQELNALKAEKMRADIAAVPTNAEARRLEAEAELNRSKRQPPEKDPLDYEAAAKIVDARIALVEDEDERAKLMEKRDDLITEEMDKARVATGRVRENRAVLGSRPGATPASREAEFFANPNAPQFKGMTDAEIEKWIKDGE